MNAIFYISTILVFIICIVLVITYFNHKLQLFKKTQEQKIILIKSELNDYITSNMINEKDVRIAKIKEIDYNEIAQIKEDYASILNKLRRM